MELVRLFLLLFTLTPSNYFGILYASIDGHDKILFENMDQFFKHFAKTYFIDVITKSWQTSITIEHGYRFWFAYIMY